ncbi:MAG: hypothetical protein IKQ62_08955 [Bacteroidaceae bacterium]|nr:hypothetical protein [Bacteroidaceae bacterium]
MKHYSCILLLLLVGTFFSNLRAQDLVVYSVTGTVKLMKGRTSSNITIRQKLNRESIVNLGAGAKLVLIDQTEKKQYTLSSTGTFSIGKLIASSQSSAKSLSDMYLSYLMKQINGKGVLTSKTAIDDTYASIERDTNDSLFSEAEPQIDTNINTTPQ